MKSKNKKSGKLFVISAPSGAGKTTLVETVLSKLVISHKIKRIITYTTKQPRAHEVHGVDYYFLEKRDFLQKIQEQFFLEWSDAYGDLYGTAREILELIKLGNSFIAIVDRRGAANIKKICEDAVLIWITPPSIEVLRERLAHRGTETQEKLLFRLNLAQQELAQEKLEPLFAHVIVNDELAQAQRELEYILRKELNKK